MEALETLGEAAAMVAVMAVVAAAVVVEAAIAMEAAAAMEEAAVMVATTVMEATTVIMAIAVMVAPVVTVTVTVTTTAIVAAVLAPAGSPTLALPLAVVVVEATEETPQGVKTLGMKSVYLQGQRVRPTEGHKEVALVTSGKSAHRPTVSLHAPEAVTRAKGTTEGMNMPMDSIL